MNKAGVMNKPEVIEFIEAYKAYFMSKPARPLGWIHIHHEGGIDIELAEDKVYYIHNKLSKSKRISRKFSNVIQHTTKVLKRLTEGHLYYESDALLTKGYLYYDYS